MSEISFKPIVTWPGVLRSPEERRRGEFDQPLGRVYQGLLHEVEKLGGDYAVVQVACRPGDVRVLDARLRSNAVLAHPGVILSFEAGELGPLSYPCDAYQAWPDNLRAIILTLERLRHIERDGVGRMGQAYAGFKALPEGPASEWATVEDAMRWVIGVAIAPGIPSDVDVRIAAGNELVANTWWRDAAKRSHPDAGGSNELMSRVNRARDFIEKARAAV